MPIHEYGCATCGQEFEALVRPSAPEPPPCPACGGADLHKKFSVPASAQTGGMKGSLPVCAPVPSGGGCGAPACGAGFCGMGNN
jgi:putative FmdB family regulatory protein